MMVLYEGRTCTNQPTNQSIHYIKPTSPKSLYNPLNAFYVNRKQDEEDVDSTMGQREDRITLSLSNKEAWTNITDGELRREEEPAGLKPVQV